MTIMIRLLCLNKGFILLDFLGFYRFYLVVSKKNRTFAA